MASKNKYSIIGDLVILETTNGIKFMIDYEMLKKCLRYTWCVSRTGYLVANINGKVTKMHRYFFNLNDPKIIMDHKNGNTMDNTNLNLRICTRTENARNSALSKNNSSGHTGIRKTKNNTYNTRITVNWKEIHIGNYKTIEEAVDARRKAELKYYGEFSPSLCRA